MLSTEESRIVKDAISSLCKKYSNSKDVRKMTTKQQQFVVCASLLATLTFRHDDAVMLVRFDTVTNGINEQVKDALSSQEGSGMSPGRIDFVFLEEHCTAIAEESLRAQAKALDEDFAIAMYKDGIRDQKKLDEQIGLLTMKVMTLANEMEK